MADEREEYIFLREDFLESVLEKYADKELFVFYDGDTRKERLTGKLLEKKVLSFTEELNKYLQPQEKVVLLLKQGLEFTCSLLGAFYANVIAIPIGANKIGDKNTLDELLTPILEDSQAKCIIANAVFIDFMKQDHTYDEYKIINAEKIYKNAKGNGARREHDLDDICTLLYTSGSSARPKGVNLTHRNMLFNSYYGMKYCGMTEDSVIVNWIPQFHAFGLMYDGLAPLMVGATTVLFSPEIFITNPKLWFQLIDKYKATHTAGSNFAYDYCSTSIDLKEVEGLSLGTIKGIFSGGEPVRIKTVQNFADKFKCLGIHENVFCPLYGMSEVGIASALAYQEPMYTLYLDIPSLIQGKIKQVESKENAKAVVSCGKLMGVNELVAVNLKTMSLCKEDEIGEIWMRGPSVAPGYLNRPAETEESFNNTIDGKTGFYRTGDLGFIRDGHIFVIGREKEVIIIHGKNYYQVDLEWTIQNYLPELTLPICVFSCDIEDEEKVCVAVEVEEEKSIESLDEIAKKITACISEQYAISVYQILFVKPKSIPKTASGKIQRKKCSILYLEDKLEKVHVVREVGSVDEEEIRIEQKVETDSMLQEIGNRIREAALCHICNVSSEKMKRVERISELGLNSIQFIQAAKKMTDTFDVKCEPVLLFKYKTISELSQYIYDNLLNKSLVQKVRDDTPIEEINESEVHCMQEVSDNDIAVIGMSCSFPGEAVNPRAYWTNLIEGNDCITEVKEKHLRLIEDFQESYGESRSTMTRWGGFIKDVECFDALFFGISTLEAESMDPQQRKAMELAWKTIEDAGYNPKSLAGSNTGVFLGAHGNDYLELIAKTPNIMDTYGAYLDTGADMSILPNRISRWFDFHGPSEVYNTACSSSLTAVHHAMEAVKSGRCDMALAGGINLILSSRCYASLSQAKMLSEEGRCKTLDESADGFVRSEGVGAILLKSFKQALRDKDNIYGILKGSATNHDGQSNSLRAPNLNAQKELIVSAYQNANVPIETVTNIEMHGTGTELGDPIEFQALKEAFEELGADGKNAYCGLSSIKTIIGHCEAASGIASVIKVLLAMKERQLPGNLHFNRLNPYIDMEETPFYRIEKSCEWKPLIKENGDAIPRRAGVSSFGIGGSNAHVVVEEYMQKPLFEPQQEEVILPFSAKTEESLFRILNEYVSYLEMEEAKKLSLRNLAYTLQVGRCSMEVRKAFIVHSIDELKVKLLAFVEQPSFLEGNKELDEDMVSKWFTGKQYEEIAKYWEVGGTVDWSLLYQEQSADEMPYRLHLPTYEFSSKAYWLVKEEKSNTKMGVDMVEVLHPLIEKNSSDFSEQKFTNHFTTEKFYVNDHRINETCILPGVITIEMARAAYIQSCSDMDLEAEQIEIRDLVWCKSISIDSEPVEVGISLYPENDSKVAFELYLTGDEIVCSEGMMQRIPSEELLIELEEVKMNCTEDVVFGSQFYRQFKTSGMEYGSRFHVIEEVHIGKGVAVAKLCIPKELEGTLEYYMLHPSMLDASLQACSSIFEQMGQTLVLPYKVGSITIREKCSSEMWAYVKQVKENCFNTQAYDIELCDTTGKVCVSFRKVEFIQAFHKKLGIVQKNKTIMFEKQWKECRIHTDYETLQVDKKVLILVEPSKEMLAMTKQFSDYEKVVLDAKGNSLKEQYKSNALHLFHELKNIVAIARDKSVLIQLLYVEKDERYLYGGLAAMLKTATEENPAIQSQVLVLEDWDVITAKEVRAESCIGGDSVIRYANGMRYVSEWQQRTKVTREEEKNSGTQHCWKDGGVYLITGGLGGIGLAVVKEIREYAKNPVLILTGRSSWDSINPTRKEEVEKIENVVIDYVQADVSERAETVRLMEYVMDKYHRLTGIIHAAGMIQDSYIAKKAEAEFLEVMKAKVDGIANLDQASAKLPIEFFCAFSSIAGCFGNIGQADYATANAFMDEYVRYRNQLKEKGLRFGHSMSISWPLWEDGGMYVDDATRHMMKERMGLYAMSSSSGMVMFYQAYASKNTHVMVMHGDESCICNYVQGKRLESRKQSDTVQVDEQVLKQVITYFKKILSAVLRTPASQLNEKRDMDEYGLDSIIIMQLNEQLEKEFGGISKTLFFEYHTIYEIAEYFVKHYPDIILELVGVEKVNGLSTESISSAINNKTNEEIDKIKEISKRQKKKRSRLGSIGNNNGSTIGNTAQKEDIAIIGLAGHYAGADTMDEFWQNLCEGKDCVTEIPKERWDYLAYFSTDKKAEGKSYSKWGGFLNDIEYFDPLFFHISPREAEKMDPQERLFLQCVQETLEDAGYTKEYLEQHQYEVGQGEVGVFVGAMFQEYQLYGTQMAMLGKPDGVYGTLSQIANRISYFYNLHGPSMSVDTMCSSSLTAIHLACESIHSGQCCLAIAGGVNVTVHPNKYIVLAQGKFASSDGKCRAFGANGDGYVPGEGVGAVLLKPVSKAVADGDHIYGVIKSTAINHGGKVSGITVPNPNAQAEVIQATLKQAQIHPRTMQYVEAHGTGTSLGDPIEITGLTKAYETYTDEKQFCKIGSVKSNIGHCESAAGMASLTKVLLQMKYKKLVPSIHSEEENLNIDFTKTPFAVQKTLEDWNRESVTIDGIQKIYPRRAAVSAFGAGGSNAHVLLEEYESTRIENSVEDKHNEDPAIILLTAKNQEQLHDVASNMLDFITSKATDDDLYRIAYTLQTGRTFYEQRLAMSVSSIEEMKEVLKCYLSGELSEKIEVGTSKENRLVSSLFDEDEDVGYIVESWIAKRKYKKLLHLWVMGLEFEWKKLYQGKTIEKISLPTYPFAKARYWFPDKLKELEKNVKNLNGQVAFIHPLLHRNTSNLDMQRFTSTFTGKEFFLRDHLVNHCKVYPGTAYIEMIRKACEESIDGAKENGICLKNIMYNRMLSMDMESKTIHIGLWREADGTICYDIHDEHTSYGQGNAVVEMEEKLPVKVDIGQLMAECVGDTIHRNECYAYFEKLGIVYGEEHRGIQCLYRGNGKVLAKLSIPNFSKGYYLHPGMLDSAIQSAMGLFIVDHESSIILPYSSEMVKIYGETKSEMWSMVQLVEDVGDIKRVDIDLYDKEGNLCVRLHNLCFHCVKKQLLGKTDKWKTMLFQPEWKQSSYCSNQDAVGMKRYIVSCNRDLGMAFSKEEMKSLCIEKVLLLENEEENMNSRYECYAQSLYQFIRKMMQEQVREPIMIQLVGCIEEEEIVYRGLAGILKTAHIENPNIHYEVIECSKQEDIQTIRNYLEKEMEQIYECEVRYQNGERYVKSLVNIPFENSELTSLPWKENGVYLITGGMGGLGYLFMKEIASHLKCATIVLNGRSMLSEVMEIELARLQDSGIYVVYRVADITDAEQMEEFITWIHTEFGMLDGVLHCAGIVRDHYIIHKTEEEFMEVIKPKVSGTCYLDKYTRKDDLDFMVFFSSQSGEEGNAGQVDYATGNAFMDAYATYRNQCVQRGMCTGKTVSINWPLWRYGGMQVSNAVEEGMWKRRGIVPLHTENGIQAFYQILDQESPQIMVLEGDSDRILKKMKRKLEKRQVVEQANVTESKQVEIQLEEYLIKICSEVMHLPEGKMEPDELFGNYGLDSVMIMQITDYLEKDFGQLSKTLFFEYLTVRELTQFFMNTYGELVNSIFGVKETISHTVVEQKITEAVTLYKPNASRSRERKIDEVLDTHGKEDIAIIGLAGHYAQADNMDEFWKNISEGKDCITEIPIERWDHSQYFDPKKKSKRKTYAKWGGFLNDIEYFDPLFFHISPSKAETMEPQERLFLQCVEETIEDAGYSQEALSAYEYGTENGKVGVFVGAMYQEYQLYGVQAYERGHDKIIVGMPSCIANRVSYYYNFHGPSIALDTMCSSSLTALHLACESLHNSECGIAIAGGVNVSIHPNKYLMLAQDKFAASDGRCKAFGEGGNGYVPGEGVGAVLLKPLSKAEKDGDHIYGVIKATAINHGGRTNGFTVPNPTAQAETMKDALRTAHMNPETISYIEAHGTGTELGDPIEITGLSNAFGAFTDKKQFCKIGSVKSNIGHCESASGMASISKVLLQMKYGKLVPSIHSERLNPNIDFGKTPFIVQHELEDWKRGITFKNGIPVEEPRRAGISAFGAGGSNACVLIEEYIEPNTGASADTNSESSSEGTEIEPAIILLSAKSKNQLREVAIRLLNFIEEKELEEKELYAIAYTLQTGRSFYEERLAISATSLLELEDKLKEYIEGRESEYYLTNKHSIASFTAFKEKQVQPEQKIEEWLSKKAYEKVLSLWVGGLTINWSNYNMGQTKKKMSLPTYPFAKERCWYPDCFELLEPLSDGSSVVQTRLHPLVHRNISTLYEERFTSTWNGTEEFLRDHVVNGKKVLPGVAYLEIARKACVEALPELENASIHISDVTWKRAFAITDDKKSFDIYIDPTEGDKVSFEMCREEEKYCQGILSVLRIEPKNQTIDIEAIKQECQVARMTGEQCYQQFSKKGLEYGSTHKGIVQIYQGRERTLAELHLEQGKKEYYISPGMLDSAIQSVIGLYGEEESGQVLPYMLESIDILRPTADSMWAVIEKCKEVSNEEGTKKVNIYLYTEDGKLALCLKKLVFKEVRKEVNTEIQKEVHLEKQPQIDSGILFYPEWNAKSIGVQHWEEEKRRLIVLCEKSYGKLEEGGNVEYLTLQVAQENIEVRYEQYAAQLFERIKSILENRLEQEMLIQLVSCQVAEQIVFRGLAGLLKTAQSENPNLHYQVIECDEELSDEQLYLILDAESYQKEDKEIYYHTDTRYVKTMKEELLDKTHIATEESLPWKENGVYWITGGMGGLGNLFAQEIVKQLHHVTLILTGRRAQDEAITQEIGRLEELGATVQYQSVDISDYHAVEELVHWIQKEYGVLHGILHCAGITKDNFILHKSVEEFKTVLKPKVSGAYQIDKATSEMKLDFIVFFSSQSGEEGNVGQADYATGNAFMDAFAEYRNQQVAEEKRYGKTVSINWPLWEEGGMNLSKEMKERMFIQRGIVPLQTNIGMRVFYNSLEMNVNQLMVIQGDIARISSGGELKRATSPTLQEVKQEQSTVMKDDDVYTQVLQDKTEWFLRDIISKMIKLPVERIKSTDTLDYYGIDSVMIMDMTDELEKTFGVLSKTLFFEYQTVKELAEYFIQHYGAVLSNKFDYLAPVEETKEIYTEAQSETHNKDVAKPVQSLRRLRHSVEQISSKNEDPIAIIGIAGKYPQAENLEQFWENLCGGKDSITEIPKERWNCEEYYGEQTARDLKCKWGGFMDDVDKFDPLFFRISHQEAKGLDPQERLFLQCAYETLEDAGYTAGALKCQLREDTEKNVGVFTGVMYNDYQLYGAQAQTNGEMIAGNGISSGVANRVSYTFDFHGPSMTVNTMCSSSLLAVHLACQSIRNGECEMALAGGINLTIHPNKYLLLAHNDFMSEKGRCSAFGKDADGYVPGEGVGAVLLKPLSKAIEDKDQIYAVVRGTAVNHGGKTNGYTVPNPSAQTDVIQRALQAAGVNAEEISYIEAHGTGTALGDPIEVNALTKAFSKDTNKKQYCSIGSVKSNIGHLESAAGIASITKVLLQMKYKKLVPSIHTEELNPNILFEETPFYVQRQLEDWDTGNALRRAGISAFGAGGTNVHIILEEYEQEESTQLDSIQQDPYIIILSGRDEAALKGRAIRLLHAIEKGVYGEKDLGRMSYTLQVGRESLEHRFAALVFNLEELKDKLTDYLADVQNIENVYSGTVREGQTTLSLFAADEDLKEAVSSWIEKRKYNKLLCFWVKGLDMDWNEFYNVEVPRKISMPTYPFAKERVWIPEYTKKETTNKTLIKKVPEMMNLHATDIQQSREIQAQDLSIKPDVSLREQVVLSIRQVFSEVSEVPVEQIDEETALEEYGMDSVMIKNFAQKLQDRFGEVPVTIFFEYQNLKSLADYLLKTYPTYFHNLLPETSSNIELTEFTCNQEEERKLSTPRSLPSSGDIAIIGMSGKYPGANNVNEFWENIKAGKDCITEIPTERWDYRKYYDSEKGKKGHLYGKWGGFIEGADKHDPLFFHTSLDHAEIADPNERLFLESVYETIEDAGYTRETLSRYQNQGLEGDVGVFVGVTFMEYQFYGVENQVKGKNIATPGIASGIANNVSYFFNFHGPSIAVDTMCSSSLTALHLACESIKNGDCQLAVAGGVNLSLHPNKYLFLSENYFLSTKGRCESFGKDGDGYVPGEGVVSVLLKPLAQAERDGDHIYGVIKASAINHGGKTNGYTVPNLQAQRGVVHKAIQEAQIHPRAISYIEAHGTGTSLGDPVEIDGLTSAYRDYTEDCGYCSIGSVKSNIGHLEAASGLAGLTKILLQMKYKMLVPSIHSNVLNENLHLERTPFYVQHSLEEWKRPVVEIDGKETELPRIAGLSSFGAGGSNAHVIIEEYITEDQKRRNDADTEHVEVIVLSAKTESSLKKVVEQLVNDVEAHKEENIRNIAYTLQVGRESMEVRLGFLVSSVEELKQCLNTYLQGGHIPNAYSGYVPKRKLPSIVERQEKRLIIEDCLQQKRYTNLLELWVTGFHIDWEKLYPSEYKPKRVSLPTYPFERIHCWLPEYEQCIDDVSLENTFQKASDNLFFTQTMEQSDKFMEKLRQLIAEDMKMDANQIDPYEELDIYGFDSIKAMSLVHKLKLYFGEIPAVILVESNTIKALSDALQSQYPEQCKQWIFEIDK